MYFPANTSLCEIHKIQRQIADPHIKMLPFVYPGYAQSFCPLSSEHNKPSEPLPFQVAPGFLINRFEVFLKLQPEEAIKLQCVP